MMLLFKRLLVTIPIKDINSSTARGCVLIVLLMPSLHSHTSQLIILHLITQGYIQEPSKLPGSHPDCDLYFTFEETPVDDFLKVYIEHPDIHEAYVNGTTMPDGHPSVSDLVR